MKNNLFINSPAYFSKEYGVEDEVYKMCNLISKNILVDKYTTAIDTIGITPIIAPQFELEKGLWKEEKKVSIPFRYADVKLRIDFDLYFNSNIEQKKRLIIQNIIDSIRLIGKKLKKEFSTDKFIKDIENILGLSLEKTRR